MDNIFKNKTTILNGLLAIVFGIVLVSYPDLTINLLATFFGLLLLVGGIIIGIGAYINKNNLPNFILGILSAVLGIIILVYPKESVAAFLLFSVGIWAIITGSILIWAYVNNNNYNRKKNPITLLFGILSLIFGIYMAINPIEGTYTITMVMGVYAILYGLHTIIYLPYKR